MKIGLLIDYHERCACGSEITLKDALRETVIQMVANWRKNHNCTVDIRGLKNGKPKLQSV